MPQSRVDITIEAQNRAQAAFEQLQNHLRESNRHLGQIAQNTTRVRRNAEQLSTAQRTIRNLTNEYRAMRLNLDVAAASTVRAARSFIGFTRSLVLQAGQLERLHLSLRTLSPSLQAAEDQYRRLIDVARLPGIDFSNALRANLQLQAIGKSGEEATRILKSFGNALALSGASTADIQRVIYGLRQLITDGVVLQRELNIVTARVPVAVPAIQERFGSIRAEGIRDFFDTRGVDQSHQAAEFIRILTEELERLPSASDTTLNALENLSDTFNRVQATVGTNLLPAVNSITAAIEGLLFRIERDEELKTAIADWTVFGTTLVTVTAGALGLATGLKLLVGLTNPIGLAALALGAVAAGFARAEVQAARLREEYNRTQDALRVGLRIGRTEDTEAIEKQIERLEARRNFLQSQIRSEEEQAKSQADSQPRLRRGEPNPLRQSTEDILEASAAYQSYQDQLFQVDKTIEILTRRTDRLGDAQENAVDIAENKLARAFNNLTEAASGTDAQIAEALQRFENAATNEEDTEVVDLARDIGSELVGIAESTSAGEIAAGKKKVDALARDNSLIIADNERLQALLASTQAATVTQLDSLLSRPRSGDELREIITLSQELARTVPAAREVYIRAVEAFNRQQRGEVRSQQAQDTIARFQELQAIRASIGEAETVEEIRQIRTQVQAFRDGLNEKRLSLETFAQEFAVINVEINRQASVINETLRGEARAGRGRTETQRRLEVRQQVGQAIESIRAAENQSAVEASVQQIQLTEATEAQILRVKQAAAQRIEELDDAALARLESIVEARIATFEDEARAQRQTEDQKQQKFAETHNYERYLLGLRRDGVAQATNELARLQERALDAGSSRRIEIVQREVQQAIDRYSQMSDTYDRIIQDLTDLSEELDISLDEALQTERIERFRDGIRNLTQDIIGLGLDRLFDSILGGADEPLPGVFRLIQDLNNVTEGLSNIRIGDVSDELSHILGGIEFDPSGFVQLEDTFAAITVSGGNLSTAISEITDSIRFERLEQDRLRRRGRIEEDTEERVRNLRARLRAVAARGGGDARQRERNIQQQQDLRFQIAEAQRAGRIRLERFDEDSSVRQARFIQDSLQRVFQQQQQQPSLVGEIGGTLETAFKNAISTSLADYLTRTAFDAGISSLSGAIGGILSGIGGAVGGALGGLLGRGDGDGQPTQQQPGQGDGDGARGGTGPGTGTGQADVAGRINQLKLSEPPPAQPLINVTATINALALSEPPPTLTVDVTGRIAKAELVEGARLPSIPNLKGGINRVTLMQNAQLPQVPGLTAEISAIIFGEDVDPPNLPAYNASISDITFAEDITAPALPSYAASIASITFAEGVTPPALPAQALMISSVAFADGIDYPNIPAQALSIASINFAEGVTPPALPSQDLMITSVKLDEGISLPAIRLPATAVFGPITGGQTGQSDTTQTDEDPENPQLSDDQVVDLTGAITTAVLDPDIDLPSITGLDGRIDSITIDPALHLRIPATAVVGAVTGQMGAGEIMGTSSSENDEDPENPIIGDDGLSGIINSLSIDPAAELPVVTGLTGVITNIVLGANVTLPTVQLPAPGGQTVRPPQTTIDGTQPASTEDVLNPQGSQYNQVAENIAKIAEATTGLSTNLNPAAGPVPRINIPDILDRLNQQTNVSTDGNAAVREGFASAGFGEALRQANQFQRPGGGGGGVAPEARAVRVTFPPEVFRELSQERTLQTGFLLATEHLSSIATDVKNASIELLKMYTFIESGMFPAIDTRLAAIEANTQFLSEIPVLERLSDSNVGLDQLPISTSDRGSDFLSNIEAIRDLNGLITPDMMLTPDLLGDSPQNPLFTHIVNPEKPPAVQDVRLVGGKIESVGSVGEIKKQVDVKHVGALAVTQEGQFVVQIAGGGTLPVRVEGGRMTVDLAGGLEGLALALADEEVGLEFTGAI